MKARYWADEWRNWDRHQIGVKKSQFFSTTMDRAVYPREMIYLSKKYTDCCMSKCRYGYNPSRTRGMGCVTTEFNLKRFCWIILKDINSDKILNLKKITSLFGYQNLSFDIRMDRNTSKASWSEIQVVGRFMIYSKYLFVKLLCMCWR